MADHAWSTIKTGEGEFKAGDEVSASKLGIDKEEYAKLKEIGTIRSKPYPKDISPNESPRERNARKLAEAVREAGEGDGFDYDLNEATEQGAHDATHEVEVPKK